MPKILYHIMGAKSTERNAFSTKKMQKRNHPEGWFQILSLNLSF